MSEGVGPLRHAWSLLRQVAAGGEHREAAVAQILRPRNLFQPYTTTEPERYPEEFARIATELPADRRNAPHILSFGCSSGDELITLAKRFPGAEITGIDINPVAVRRARQRVREAGLGERVRVLRAADADTQPTAAYDVVLALAVFRHGHLNAGPESCRELLRFEDFDRTVFGLCRTLRRGGLFVIRHANFRFSDTAGASDFQPVVTGFPSSSAQGLTPTYGPDDRIVGAAQRDDGIYRRIR
ncbi:SAM-dependent methyltransferase [Nocardioides montaniterrae]